MLLRRSVCTALATMAATYGQSDRGEKEMTKSSSDQDEVAIRFMLAEGGEKNWNNHQMEASVTPDKVIDDAIFINVYGGWVKGRETFKNVISRLHAPGGSAHENTRRQQIEELRFIRPDVALAVVKYFDIRQAGVPTGEEVRGLMILSKENGRWKINALENTMIAAVVSRRR